MQKETAATKAGVREVRTLAIHLPQFHPTPENDEWWGPGFTEWTNVVNSKPFFPGHQQPRHPANLGHYDLRVREVRAAQAKLAAAHGIDGFAYYHYWFSGRRLLHDPIDRILREDDPAFPFCLLWANETWSRRWLGEEREILIKQSYSDEDDIAHAEWLAKAAAHPAYIRQEGRPVFGIYRPLDLPDPKLTTQRFREVFAAHGLPEPYLIGCNAHCPGTDLRTHGFDATLDFLPALDDLRGKGYPKAGLHKLLHNRKLSGGHLRPSLNLHHYDEAWQRFRARTFRQKREFPMLPCAFVGWDNSPRRGRKGIIMTGATPRVFEENLRWAHGIAATDGRIPPLLFINAWNEWAEGNCLEPDMRNGTGWLEAVKRVTGATPPSS